MAIFVYLFICLCLLFLCRFFILLALIHSSRLKLPLIKVNYLFRFFFLEENKETNKILLSTHQFSLYTLSVCPPENLLRKGIVSGHFHLVWETFCCTACGSWFSHFYRHIVRVVWWFHSSLFLCCVVWECFEGFDFFPDFAARGLCASISTP